MPNPWEKDWSGEKSSAPPAPANAMPWEKYGAEPEGPPSKFGDFVRSIPRGIMSGFAGAASALGKAEAPSSGIDPNEIPGQEEATKILEKNVTGELHQPQTGAGKYGATVGEFLGNPATYVGPGGMMAKGLTAVGGALGSEAAGQYTAGQKFEPVARMIGAIAGGHVVAGVPRVVTPNIISPERQSMLGVLRDEGVTGLTAGQQTGNKGLKWAESTLADVPFSGQSAEAINEAGAGQFTRAALRRVGEDADRATPQVVDRAFTRIGGEFDRLTGRNSMPLDQALQNEMLSTTIDYHHNVNPMARSPVVENTMDDIAAWAGKQGGQLTGEQYQNLRSRLGKAARGSTDPQLSHALSDMTEHLDDAMSRSIATANPRDAGAFDEVRRQYRNMLAIERAASAGGENAAMGFISPANLSGSAKAVMGRRAYARGEGDFAELARAGEAIMKPLPQSGTAPRENVLHLLQLAGLLGGEHAGGLPGAMAAGAAGAAVPAIGARALLSRPVQGYLANQLLPYRTGTSPTLTALVNAMRGTP